MNNDDTISRAEAIKALCKAGCGSEYCGVSCDDVKAIEDLPSAQSTQTNTPNALNALDCISRQAAIDAFDAQWWERINIPISKEIRNVAKDTIKALPSAQPESCEGCKHLGKWENEVEYGYPSPCTRCKRRVEDHYER